MNEKKKDAFVIAENPLDAYLRQLRADHNKANREYKLALDSEQGMPTEDQLIAVRKTGALLSQAEKMLKK